MTTSKILPTIVLLSVFGLFFVYKTYQFIKKQRRANKAFYEIKKIINEQRELLNSGISIEEMRKSSKEADKKIEELRKQF